LAAHKKTAQQRRSLLIFLDESGFSERPSVRRTWAPRGKTPVLVLPFNWKRLAAIASLITTPAARRVGLCLRLLPGTVNKFRVRDYLREVKRHVRGRRVILLWDRLPAHRSSEVQGYIRRQRKWLTAEYLPAYAPELNPVEYFWAHVSGTDMANFIAEDLDSVRRQVCRTACKVRHRVDLGRAFLKHSGLFECQ
jgi:transposase